ncbi:hypothetical protein GCM10023216_01850 [Isoptericola chiayiensis]|uniref:Glycoside hydrolase family 2 sugar binding protein n=1 Tax=Isoptericola chiayiensis TaxID=579446 RepID=A0ABP8Y1C6_9MICO|nr:hypothetical protein [Isoptericola chiayiensis]
MHAHDVVSGPVGPYAFVFWNDDLDDAAVVDRLRELAGAGFVGVTLSARVGLSRRVGYLTDEYLRLVRVAVDECARLGLAVMLYDEASYPSGSANGAVVARDPGHAARCLVPVVRDVVVPGNDDGAAAVPGYWRPALGRDLDARLLAVVARRVHDGVPADDGARLLPVRAPGVVLLDLAPGTWQVTAVYDAASGGTIRGAHAEEDDGSALAPPAADLLDPAAVAAFVELTHDAYAAALDDHLGSTVVAMFTDEPFLLGRGHRPHARPYTRGLEDEAASALGTDRDDVLRRLPTLWDDDGTRPGGTDPAASGFARTWADVVRDRLARVYYGALAAWCARHGIALTGHPAEPDDLATTGLLDWPGQDTVWRWVLPGPTALEGPESTAAKVAASAARRRGAPALTEVLGAYGWRLDLDEARWLLDWYLSRGVTVPVFHAFFASVRGGRAFESEPDLGVHNSWWPHLPPLVAYVRRVAELMAAHPPVWSVGVLCPPDAAPSGGVVRALLQGQVDFGYTVDGAGYDVVVDPADGVPDAAAVRHRLEELGRPAVNCVPAAPDLRAVVLGDDRGTVFFHEGEEPVATRVRVPHVPAEPCWWDPFTDRRHPVSVASDGRVDLRLRPRQTLALVTRSGPVEDGHPPDGPRAGGDPVELSGWTGVLERAICDLDEIQDAPGDAAAEAPVLGLGDWTQHPVLRRFAGTYRYATTFTPTAAARTIDLGDVGGAATVLVDGVVVGHALSAPYEVDLPVLDAGEHRLEVLVSNSAANYYEGAGSPSGLIGPVTLRPRHHR